MKKTIWSRLISKIKINGYGCWEWTGALTGDSGYAEIRISGKNVKAHVVTYTMFKGEIPDKMEIDHLCRNRKCVNPKHLEAVPHAVNVWRGAATKLNAELVSEIRASKEPSKLIARRMGITYRYVNMLRRGISWKDVCM